MPDHHTPATNSMRVSVIVPLYIRDARDVELLVKLLLQLAQQSRPADHLIFVDDASPIPVLDIVQSNVSSVTKDIRIFCMQQNSGPAAARNIGILQAQAMNCDIVCFLDADCAPDIDWIKIMADAHMQQDPEKGPTAYSGRTRAAQPCGWVGQYHDFYGTLNGPCIVHPSGQQSPEGHLVYGPTCNFSMRITPGMAPIMFDVDFPAASFEDVEWCCRVRGAGISICLLENAVVHHAFDESVEGLARQFWRYGRWEGLVEEKHPGYLALLTACWAKHSPGI